MLDRLFVWFTAGFLLTCLFEDLQRPARGLVENVQYNPIHLLLSCLFALLDLIIHAWIRLFAWLIRYAACCLVHGLVQLLL